MLQHTGHIKVPDEEDMTGEYEAFAVILKVLKPKNTYPAALRHGIKSRKISSYEGHTLKIESILKLDWIGSEEELLLMAQEMPTMVDKYHSIQGQKKHQKAQIALSRVPDSVYKALNDAKVFNLCLEPATKYNLCRFVDKSREEVTSDRLRQEVLYLETPQQRFEIARFTTESYA